MKIAYLVLALAAAFACWMMVSGPPGNSAEAKSKQLAHMVYFTLKDDSDAAQQRLVRACQKLLKDHPGVVYFSAGTRAREFDREVNDQNYHVGLHLVFADKAAHDKYQDAPTHTQFIEENRDNWQQVRVFDTYLE
jgi:hypothetical protein